MIDSININVCIWLNIANLQELNIRFNKFKGGIFFEYKNIKFVYYPRYKNLSIMTTTHKLLQKTDITISDKEKFEYKLNEVINEIIFTKNYNYLQNANLTRIDYYIDINEIGELKKLHMQLLKKHATRYKYLIRNNDYKTSNYLSTKSSQKRINIYDKHQCGIDKLNEVNHTIRYNKTQKIKDRKKELEFDIINYKNTIRLEIQLKKNKLKNNAKRNKPRSLDEYWNIESMKEEFFNYLDGYLFKGIYYKISLASKIISDSDYSIKWKGKLIKFIIDIENYGLDNLSDNGLYSANTIKSYIEKLNNLNINPIAVNEDAKYDKVENLLKIAKEVAKEKYFK